MFRKRALNLVRGENKLLMSTLPDLVMLWTEQLAQPSESLSQNGKVLRFNRALAYWTLGKTREALEDIESVILNCQTSLAKRAVELEKLDDFLALDFVFLALECYARLGLGVQSILDLIEFYYQRPGHPNQVWIEALSHMVAIRFQNLPGTPSFQKGRPMRYEHVKALWDARESVGQRTPNPNLTEAQYLNNVGCLLLSLGLPGLASTHFRWITDRSSADLPPDLITKVSQNYQVCIPSFTAALSTQEPPI